MTEREKAKAYDEAIERAKKLYGNGITKEIFPELKEDDTDRIKKNCIHFLELQKQHHAATFEIEECIDWLEKQGKKILGGLKMKTYNDVNIGDTVYIWVTSDSSVDETTITEKHDDRGHWNLKFSNGCVGRALKNGTSSTMGMYACLVYSDKEAVRESINERIKILSNIKI